LALNVVPAVRLIQAGVVAVKVGFFVAKETVKFTCKKVTQIATLKGATQATAKAAQVGKQLVAKEARVVAKKVAKSGTRKRLAPNQNATGTHTSFRKDPLTNRVTHYETYAPQTNSRNPSAWESVKRFDNSGKTDQSHYNKLLNKEIHEPHVHELSFPGGVREAISWEIPN